MIFAALIQTASSLVTDSSALESSISALESCISALESDIKTLESSSTPWEHRVWAFTFLVVIGVAMELWVIRHEYRDDMEAWALAHFGILRSPGRPSIAKWGVEVGSVLLITIGIVGELGIGIEIASINGKLRGKGAELRSKNAELRISSDRLIALLNIEAEEIRASVAPRRLTDGERKSIHVALNRFARQKVVAWHNTFDVEASVFAVDLLSGLRGAGWNTSPKLTIGGNISAVAAAPAIPETGIWISVMDGDTRGRAAAEAAVRCFNSLGYNARISPKSFGAANGRIAIEVKPRPIGPQGEAKLRADAKKKQLTNSQIAAP